MPPGTAPPIDPRLRTPSDPPFELGRPVRQGLRWGLASQAVIRLITVASTVALLRLVGPEDYGTFVFALAVATVVMSVNDVGQSVAVSRWPVVDLESAQRCGTTVAWAGSGASFLGCLMLADPLSRLGGAPGATGVIRLMAVLVLIDGLTAVPRALLLRTFRHRRIVAAELAATPVNVAVTLGLAAGGAGMWAPAVGTLAAAVVTGGVVLLMAPLVPRPGWDRRVVGETLRFGAPWSAALLIEVLLLNVDYVVVGSQLGPVALGVYAVAFNVASWPATLFTHAIRRVSVVGFAQLQDRPAELAGAFFRAATLLVTLLLPLCVGLAVVADPLLRILYGTEVAAVGSVLSWLVVLTGARVTAGLVVDVLLAQGRTRAAVGLHVVWLLVAVPTLVLAARAGGVTGVAVGHALVGLVLLVLHLLVLFRGLDAEPAPLLRELVRPVAAATVAATLGFLALAPVPGPWLRLIAGGATVALAYGLALGPSRVRGLTTRGTGDPEPQPLGSQTSQR
jgi:PST family polysaccharide transporter